MAKKRTKKQKSLSAQRRLTEAPVQTEFKRPGQVATREEVNSQNDIQARIGTPVELVYKDLRKTLVVSSIAFIILFGIYIYLR